MYLVDGTGATVASYEYDPYGNILSATGDMAEINPLRYRGYYYDTELKMYYLQSRYYDPAIGRFINADSFISTDSGVLGSNMFAYCGNNPVMGYDPTGHFNWGKLFNGASLLAVGIVACAAAVTVVSGGACTPLLVAACATFVAGGMTVLNGAAEVVESFTDYNFMRDGVMGGNEELYEAQKEFFSTTAEIGTAVITMGSGSGKLCFAAGTVILINEGRKAIEDIVVGDYVWAWDEETGEKSLRRVTETYVNQTSELVHVFVGGEEIVTTPTHPFYSPVKGWTEAAQLRAGDILVLVNGEYVVVEKVQHEILESPINVYNFQVAGDHTYYVSDIGVLVHNGCERGVGGKGWRGDATWKQNVRTVANGGDVTNLNGGLPTLEEAKALIAEAKGIIKDFHYAHYPDGKNTHLYEHLHYLTEKGIKGVIKVFGG